MEMLKDYGLFLGKTITIVLALIMVIRGIVAVIHHEREAARERLIVKKLNQHYDYLRETLRAEMLPKAEHKKALKELRKREKEERKRAKHSPPPERKRIFVLTFKGDLLASTVASLREEVTAVLTVARPSDEVLVRVESSGGIVNAYGLAATQLLRFKQRQIPLFVAVDRIAASGGYLMASVADRILAAPFAVLGSIGVVAEFPNFHRLLKKHDIDVELITAGEYKRTLTLFGENTPKGRAKFIEQLEEVHALFKEFLAAHRAQLDLAAVATGEYWFGKRALDLKLADELITSDDYLYAASENADIYEVTYKPRESLRERLAAGIDQTLNRVLSSWWERGRKNPLT